MIVIAGFGVLSQSLLDVEQMLEAFVFNFIDSSDKDELHIPIVMVDDWFTKLNEIEFNLKSYLF